METPKPLLKNLGAKLRLMMAEDWRGEDERNTLGMAGHWLEKLGEDQPKCCERCGRELLPDLEESTCVVCSESCQCKDQSAVYRDGVPWCINCHAQIITESRIKWNVAQSTTHTPDINELRKDLRIALQWIDDGFDEEGHDLIVAPMMAKHF